MIVVSGVFVLAGIYLSCYVAYWAVLLGVHFFFSARSTEAGAHATKFAIVIPAHNEQLLLPRLLASAGNQEYPRERFDTIVVADNCTDGTADAARHHGVRVLERFDEGHLGKGYALKWALEHIDLSQYDAILIVDADCVISANALQDLDGAMREKQVVQCYSGIANPDESWFTRLLDVSRTINNDIYSRAKQRLGLSCQLIGTGMCFGTPILKAYGWDALTIGEDCEYYAKIIQNGETVGFEWNAKVYHQESSSLQQATSQRMRWSSGKFAVASRYSFPLLSRGVIERNVVKFDAGLTLLFPNPSLGMNVTLVCLAGAVLGAASHGGVLAAWFLLLALMQLGVFLVGVFYTKNRFSKFLAIFIAPLFLIWKMGIDLFSVLGFGRERWIRTDRRI